MNAERRLPPWPAKENFEAENRRAASVNAKWRRGKAAVAAVTAARFFRALERSVDRLRRERVPYAVIGAWALAVWGRPRATLDLDFLAMLDEEQLDRLAVQMERAGMEVDRSG